MTTRKRRRNEEDILQANSDVDSLPVRKVQNLFCASQTKECALSKLCVPCAYKLGAFDVALDSTFCTTCPNQRPELCPRSNCTIDSVAGRLMGYQPGVRVLTVGDGDFSFSVALARLIFGISNNCQSQLVATSYESRDTNLKVYPNFETYEKELKHKEAMGVSMGFQVDATQLKKTLRQNINSFLPNKLFHRIVWNFPCTAIASGQDGQNNEMEDNKRLVRDFVENARHLLTPAGEIHICHKTKPPFNHWHIEEVALESCQESEPTIEYKGRIAFDKCLFPPYQPRKALHSKSFPCHDACFYIFQVDGWNEDSVRPTFSEKIAEDIPGENCLIPVTKGLVSTIREKFMVQAKEQQAKQKPSRKHKGVKSNRMANQTSKTRQVTNK